MASITIDKDLRESVSAGTLTHAQAWEINDLRKDLKRLVRKAATLRGKLAPLEEDIATIKRKIAEIRSPQAQPTATEPSNDTE